jgi:hypothetical protein
MDKRFYEPANDVFDFGSFRVYPGNTETFTFTGANQTLSAQNQGHKIYVIVESEGGALEEAVSESVFFRPVVEDIYVRDANNVIVTFNHPFSDGASVEESFDMYITADERRRAEFRAYSILPDQGRESFAYRLSLVYDQDLKDAYFVAVEPKGNPADGMETRVNVTNRPLLQFNAVHTLNNTVEISGITADTRDIYWVLTNEYVKDFRKYTNEIRNQRFPVTGANNTVYGSLLARNGEFHDSISGFPDIPEYYYLYVYAGDFLGVPEAEIYVIKPEQR